MSANDPWVWIDPAVILAVHEEQLAEHGGAAGARNAGLLDSALARPRNLAVYGQPDICELADKHKAMVMVDSGTLSPAEVRDFPHGNVILQALGVQEQVAPVISEVDLEPGDTIMLCSDGLHGPVSDEQIAAVMGRTEHLSACARTLIHVALEAGGPDNVTVLLARRVQSR